MSAANQEVTTMEHDSPELMAGREHRASMVQDLRKMELVRDRLESLEQLVGSLPEGHNTRMLLENMHLNRALRVVEGDLATLRDTLLYPRDS
jgi:hypothetical protein